MDGHEFWVAWDKCQVADRSVTRLMLMTPESWTLILKLLNSCTMYIGREEKSNITPGVRSVLVWIYLIKRQRRKTWFLYWERAHCSIFRVSALQSQSWMEIRSWHKIGDDMMVHCDTSITESEGQVTRTVTLFVQSPDHPIVTFSLSVVIHFSAKSPENNVNLMLPPFTAAWFLRFLFGKFLLTCCGLWKTCWQ